jgi:hypothetical protein
MPGLRLWTNVVFRSMAFPWTRAIPLPLTTPECTQCTSCCMKPGRECGMSESHRQRSTHICVRLDCEEGSFTETLWFVTQPYTSCAVCGDRVHDGDCEVDCPLGCDYMLSGSMLPTVWRNLLPPPSSVQHSEASIGNVHHVTWCHNPEDGSLHGITFPLPGGVVCVACCLNHIWRYIIPWVGMLMEEESKYKDGLK